MRHGWRKILALGIFAGLVLASVNLAAVDLEDYLFDLYIVPLDKEPSLDFRLESLEGKKVSLKGLRGRAVLLYFWATW
jgi:cytochrome oxidase Cu insertion factor (SCO1/SenC/PrrC family)